MSKPLIFFNTNFSENNKLVISQKVEDQTKNKDWLYMIVRFKYYVTEAFEAIVST